MAQLDWSKIMEATRQTTYITVVVLAVVAVLGLLLGIILTITDKNGLKPNKIVYAILSILVNVIRSVPTMILLVLLIPFTKILIGRISGSNAALPTLIIGATPFFARLVQNALSEVHSGVVEAARSMGASTLQIITKVLIPESMPSLIAGLTTTGIAIVGATTIAGMIGAGGLGNLAYYTGFMNNNTALILACTGLILVIVFVIQYSGEFVAKKVDKR